MGCLALRNSDISPAFPSVHGKSGSTKMERWYQKAICRHPSKFRCLINALSEKWIFQVSGKAT